MFIKDFLSYNGGSHGCNTLLAVNEDLFTYGLCAVFQLYIWVLPNNYVSNGKTLVEGIDKIAHFRAVPDKGALHFRDSYVS